MDLIGVPPRPPTAFPLYPHNRKQAELTVISTLAEVENHAAKLDLATLDLAVLGPGYVGFDLELTKKQEVAYVQVSVSDDKTIVIKIGEFEDKGRSSGYARKAPPRI